MIIKATINCPKHGPTKIRLTGKWSCAASVMRELVGVDSERGDTLTNPFEKLKVEQAGLA